MKLKQKLANVLIATLVLLQAIPTYASGWEKSADRWRYQTETQGYVQNAWAIIDNWWYRFDETGKMLTGWYQENEHWYFLMPGQGSRPGTVPLIPEGAMLTGWQWIDGRCYYFSTSELTGYPQGAMYAGAVTPDGYWVDTYGAWIDDAGNVISIPGKGIRTISSVDLYAAGNRSGGSGGGGGSSRPQKPSEPDLPEDDFVPDEDEPLPEEPEDGDTVATPSEPDEEDTTATPSEPSDPEATPSETEMVDWQIRFVDKESHQIEIAAPRRGRTKDGETLTVNYRSKIIDDEGRIWKALVPPPFTITVYGPGKQIYYIEFEQDGIVEEEKDPWEEERLKLKTWLDEAKSEESKVTGESTEHIPDSRFIVDTQGANDIRLITFAGQIEDSKEHTAYVIGKNILPSGTILKDFYRDEIEYSNLTVDQITIGKDIYTISRFAIKHIYNKTVCRHDWNQTVNAEATCLRKGRTLYYCNKCGLEETVIVAALGHLDQNGDSICERCNTRSFEQHLGSEILAELSINGQPKQKLSFQCIDEDYQGGMLYVSNESISVQAFGGYGSHQYLESNPYRYFASGWQNGFSISGASLMVITVDGQAGYAALLSKEEAIQYQLQDYLTRTSGNNGLIMIEDSGTVVEVDSDSESYGIRPAILLKKPDVGQPEPVHWNIGDMQAREIGEETYLFRCIDDNYSDKTDTHRRAALFLCDSVIPASWGSKYEYRRLEDGTYGYVFIPGPVVNFGQTNDYKYSNIRNWLRQSEQNFYNTEPINIGVSYAYTGSTEENQFSQLTEEGLSVNYIGNQRMADKLFILSVDEALKYKNWLWKFDGSDEDNPESQYGAFSKGYWLRNPMGTSRNYDTGMVYMVDLVNGNIHFAGVRPADGTGDVEIDVTCTTGIRPAFTMPQD